MLVANLVTRRNHHKLQIEQIKAAGTQIAGHQAHIAEIDRHLASLGVDTAKIDESMQAPR